MWIPLSSMLAFWVTLNVQVSTFPKWHILDVWALVMAVKCWNVQCLGVIASLRTFPSMKENQHFIWCAIINTH